VPQDSAPTAETRTVTRTAAPAARVLAVCVAAAVAGAFAAHPGFATAPDRGGEAGALADTCAAARARFGLPAVDADDLRAAFADAVDEPAPAPVVFLTVCRRITP
jgi:hypothetical protein